MDETKQAAKSLARIAQLYEQELQRAGQTLGQLDEQQMRMRQQKLQLEAFFASYARPQNSANSAPMEAEAAASKYNGQLLRNRYHFVERLDQALEELETRLAENQTALQGARVTVYEVARKKRGVELLAQKSESELR